MTLVSRAQQLDEVLQLAHDAERTQERLGRAHDSATSLNAVAEDLAGVREAVVELRRVSAEDVNPELRLDCESLVSVLKQVKADLGDSLMVHVEKDYASVAADARDVGRRLRGWAASAWAKVIDDQNLPEVNTDLVDDLERAGLDVEEIQNAVVTAQSELMLLQGRPLPKAGDGERLDRVKVNLHKAVELLKERLPDAVATFIAAAGRSPGADLSFLTKEVHDFLIEHEIDARYGIRLK